MVLPHLRCQARDEIETLQDQLSDLKLAVTLAKREAQQCGEKLVAAEAAAANPQPASCTAEAAEASKAASEAAACQAQLQAAGSADSDAAAACQAQLKKAEGAATRAAADAATCQAQLKGAEAADAQAAAEAAACKARLSEADDALEELQQQLKNSVGTAEVGAGSFVCVRGQWARRQGRLSRRAVWCVGASVAL